MPYVQVPIDYPGVVPKFIGVWILLCSSVGVGTGGAVGAGNGVAGGIGVGAVGGSAHVTIVSRRLAVRKVAIRKFILDSIISLYPHTISELSQSLYSALNSSASSSSVCTNSRSP